MVTVNRAVFNTLEECVEQIAKVCTDAEVKGDPAFMHRLWGMRHLTPFEHNSFVTEDEDLNALVIYTMDKSEHLGMYQPAFRINPQGFASGSLRAWHDLKPYNGMSLDKLLQVLLPDPYHLRKTLKVVTNIGVAREILRHRELSFTERSTRYVKTFQFAPTIDNTKMTQAFADNLFILRDLANHKIKRDHYREILPLGTQTSFYVTGFIDQFQHLIDLRDTVSAHAGARAVAQGIKKELAL